MPNDDRKRRNSSEPEHQQDSTKARLASSTMVEGTQERKWILVTGGCGYIGSHTITSLINDGYSVVVVDNMINSSAASLDRVAKITNLTEESQKERIVLHNVDICDGTKMREVFEQSPKFTSCIHFAGLKVSVIVHSVSERLVLELWCPIPSPGVGRPWSLVPSNSWSLTC